MVAATSAVSTGDELPPGMTALSLRPPKTPPPNSLISSCIGVPMVSS